MSPTSDSGAPSPRASETTQEIVGRARATGPAGFRELYERLAPSLLAWSRIQLSDRSAVAGDADDVLQEVWLRALTEFADYDPARSSFRSWLFGIAKNVLYEMWRQGQRRAQLPRSAEQTAALEAWPDVRTTIRTRLARDEVLELLLRRVETMDPLDRTLLLHCGFEDMSCPEAARRTGIEVEAASKRWQRLRRRLAEQRIDDLLDPCATG
jgi:RNA polymerase sigma-70 factor, ECF subfamily